MAGHTHNPYKIEYQELELYADLAAERLFAAERADNKIVVEVKSFLHPSKVQDLKLALGQYNLYQSYFEVTAPERKLYLAISDDVHANFFAMAAVQLVVERFQISLLVVNIDTEEVVAWIK